MTKITRQAAPEAPVFPAIAIGASAGGSEALEELVQSLGARGEAIFLVLQHNAVEPPDKLREILQDVSALPVEFASAGQLIKADTIHLITSRILVQASPDGPRFAEGESTRTMPVDELFKEVASVFGDRAMGVVLSGAGSDGLAGARALKHQGGSVLAQSPKTALFANMPRGVVDAGLVDAIGSPAELAVRVGEFIALKLGRSVKSVSDWAASGALEAVYALLRAQTGHDFSLYKKSTILRRIDRRMHAHQLSLPSEYTKLLRDNPAETRLLFKELLIGVTGFFRDPEVWNFLREQALPQLLISRRERPHLRAWVAGCSTGEEAYSLAIVFREVAERLGWETSLQIFATDLHKDAVEHARRGVYSEADITEVSAERLRRYFVREDGAYRVCKEIRSMVVFATQNLVADPPFTKLDILSCRNLLIYLSAELQRKIIPLFYYSMRPGGLLMLGTAETVGSLNGLFHGMDGKTRIFQRGDQSTAAVPVDFPSVASIGSPEKPLSEGSSERPKSSTYNLQQLVEHLIVQRYAPVGILCNAKGDILYISGRVGKYLEPAVGKANMNIFAMARDSLRYELAAAFSSGARGDEAVHVRGVRVDAGDNAIVVDATVTRVQNPRELRGTTLVIIQEVGSVTSQVKKRIRKATKPLRVQDLERELERARAQVHTTREEMQTSQEELRSTNEELQSTNEELQSTNEELTTSKEEMQSLNEELRTVNNELQSKVDELSRFNNDMKNLLNSTDIATLFLDGSLRVRRFTPPVSKIIKLISSDHGRPITDIASELLYPNLVDDARGVLATLVPHECEKVTQDGRWFLVRIVPYRTLENVIDGVVVTFADITTTRAAAHEVQAADRQLHQVAEILNCLVLGHQADGTCDFVNTNWTVLTGKSADSQSGFGWVQQVVPADRERVMARWHSALRSGRPFAVQCNVLGLHETEHLVSFQALPVRRPDGGILRWINCGSIVDTADSDLDVD